MTHPDTESPDARSALPSVDELLRRPEFMPRDGGLPRALIAGLARNVLADQRKQLEEHAVAGKASVLTQAAAELARRVERECRNRLQPVINATGILVHTNLGRAPLSARATQRVLEAAGSCNLEWNPDTGGRGQRGAYVERVFQQLTGAEACLVVNNCAAATLLTLQSLAAGRSVLISRGQLVEIGGSYRLPDIFGAAGVRLCEVGTTNRTTLDDYSAAIADHTAAILRVHQSNFRMIGFTGQVDIGALAKLGRDRGLPVIDDLGSGCLHDLQRFGIDEPQVGHSLAGGAEIVLFSGDKLLGGPQAGVILGKRPLIDRMRAHPLARAVRIDKLTLAALEGTMECHLAGLAFEEIPILRSMAEPAAELRRRCELLVQHVTSPAIRARCEIRVSEMQVGGGAAPGHALQSWAVVISGESAECAGRLLRDGRPAVVGRVQDGRLWLDLCTVAIDQLPALAEALSTRLAAN